jgi:NAD-reducing hydrogenase large subunit
VHQVRLHIVEFRGFEKFIQGRPYWEVPVMVQRLCGICPVSHHLAASKALDIIVGAKQLTPTAEKMRRLMHLGQILQSHALHFFHLASPDLLFGFDAEVAKRNVVHVAAVAPEVAKKGVLLRKVRPGDHPPHRRQARARHRLGAGRGEQEPDPRRARRAARRDRHHRRLEPRGGRHREEALRRQREALRILRPLRLEPALGLVRADGALDLYHGGLRATDAKGGTLFDHADYQSYYELIHEEVKPWSYMKFPFIVEQGTEAGWYRVGPLARVAQCDFIPTDLAEAERVAFKAFDGGAALSAPLGYHWARMIEMLHAAEGIKELLLDNDLSGGDLVVRGERSCAASASSRRRAAR